MINSQIPAEKAELVALCALPGVRHREIKELLTMFGSPAGAVEAVRKGFCLKRVSGEKRQDWLSHSSELNPQQEMRRLESGGIRVAVPGEPGYPELLVETSDFPFVLFYRGRLPPRGSKLVAVVGSRKATPYGLEVAGMLAEGLARAGVWVVSGAAYGIDSAAHRGALRVDVPTMSVLGCGVDVAYPRSNRGLFSEIRDKGCIMSEYPPGTRPLKHHFPARNRLIAGVSLGVVVVEASRSSGALITADFALEAGRDVLAVPGRIISGNSRGTNALIKSGAAIVTCVEDVLAELGIQRPDPPLFTDGHVRREEHSGASLLDALSGGDLGVEGIAGHAGITVQKAISLLSQMEVAGLVRRGPGGRYDLTAEGSDRRAD